MHRVKSVGSQNVRLSSPPRCIHCPGTQCGGRDGVWQNGKPESRAWGSGRRGCWPCPPDGVAGVPRAELIGDNEVFLEHYRGILAYGKEEIHVDGGGWVLRILGRNLEIKAMRAGELRISGVVTSLTLV